jgi:D-alanyl-D-alanine carboxypeptidase/D-alanyl-D-alanine-endopeptidase (penicillin-binding protein 4)
MRFFHNVLALAMIFSIANMTLAAASNHHSSARHKVSKHRVVKKARPSAYHPSSRHVAKTPRKRVVESTAVQVPGQIQGKNQLVYVLNRIISSSDTGTANIGVYVKSLKTGDALFVRNIYQSFTPASIMKILTAEAALIYLGSDYRFSTQLLTDAKGVTGGVLQGNLYIVLNGDPSLTYPDLVELMTNLQAQGISAIAGNVYIDNTAYDQRFYGPGWIGKDKTYCYAAPISASIINHNCLPLALQRSDGQIPKVSPPPPKRFNSGKKHNFATRSSRLASSNIGWGVNYVVTDIPEFNRNLFKGLLRKFSVDVYGVVTFGSAPHSLSLVATHNSQPLPQLVRDMLKKSDNVIAGALFKKLGQLYSNRPGSWENGSIAVSQILSKQAGVQTSGMRLLDGSGLSIDNLATPAQFMQVLQYAYNNGKTSEHFISALPIAGVDGTLKHRMGNISHKIRAKTGTISGVVSLAGYATTSSKDSLAFVIIINGNKGLHWRYKGMEDKIATALTHFTES